MLAIRLSRTGRKGHAMFRLVVQDSRLAPTSGKVVAYVGHYDPHSKSLTIDKDKISHYLSHGAQPSPRVARILKSEGVKLPAWVQFGTELKRQVRNPAKRRSTRPAGEEEPAKPEPAEDNGGEPAAEEAKADEAKVEPKPVDQPEEKTDKADKSDKAKPEKAAEAEANKESADQPEVDQAKSG